MSRYIDADKLWEEIDNEDIYTDFESACIFRMVREKINNAPTADVVEVKNIVQCKDCIYSQQFIVPASATGTLFHCDYFMRTVGDGYGFCKWGCKYSSKEEKEITNEQIH